ncbi:MAG: lytic murein transglycosylase [Pseudomonadota bacterium]
MANLPIYIRRSTRWAIVSSLVAVLGACAAGPYTPQVAEPIGGADRSTPDETPSVITPVDPVAPYTPSGNASMDAWRIGFAARASAQGRDPAVIRSMLEGINPLDIYLGNTFQTQSDVSEQAEFAKPIWEYLRTAVTATRIDRGRDRYVSLDVAFTQLEGAYGVDRETLLAIWGMETNFGSYMGDFDAANTLSNMAVEGRRRRFAENELIALMKIVETGAADRNQLVSGWAGAMGHTQFMPSTFLAHATDFTGDGNIDLWESPEDALASAANYLSVSGFESDQPWGLEVTVPNDFDYSLADGQDRRVGSWTAQGIQFVDGARGVGLTDGKFAELWVPAGSRGPKFLLFKNFDVFKTYNRADSYALAVGLLSDEIAGRAPLQAAWPTDLQPLSVAQVKQLQSGLNSMGFEAGAVDGIAGRGTKGALRRFQDANGFIADGYPTTEMLAYVLNASG